MAEIKEIQVGFNPIEINNTFGLPNRIEVPIGTIIKWVIPNPKILERVFREKSKFRYGIEFTLYFDKSSPFKWNSERLMVVNDIPLFYPFLSETLIASGAAINKGDHKYGLKLSSINKDNKDEPDYDDDPYITVY